ncbi:hypothetical protein PTKIN_Ptkin05aG0018200 [Pterospermum kingtungense]
MDKMSTLEYINQMFPTEASLSGVEPLMQKIQSEIRRVDAGILAAVRQQSNSGTKAKEDLAAATHAVEELTYKIHEIKTKAEQSAMMVQEICRDVKKLDFAKKHITTTITVLHRLTMLEQLQVMASKRQYKEAAAQLEAVNQLCSHFEAYRDIPKITELREKFKNIKQIMKSHVFSDFSSLGTGKESEETNLLHHLSDACLAVDALEPSVREELVNNFCSRELTSYKQIFEGAELAKLDKMERRYAWIKRRMRTNEEIWKIFPTSWLVPYRLCIQFCKLTRKQLEGILDSLKEKPDVATLLMALQRTLEFEDELAEKFGGGTQSREIGNEIEEIGRQNKDERVICYTVNSAEYCHKTPGELAESVSKIIDSQFADQVDMSEVQDEYSTVITQSLVTLVHGLETKFDAEMAAMTPVPWATLESVGDQSGYVNGITCIIAWPTVLNEHFQMQADIRNWSPTNAVRYASCKDNTFGNSFTWPTDFWCCCYSKFVILSPVDSVADTYRALLPERTRMEFKRILELKGLKKSDQQSILDDFSKGAPAISQPPSMAPVGQLMPPSPPVTTVAAIPDPASAGFIASREDVLTRAAALGLGAATTGFKRFLALTEAAKDRKDGPFRKLFNA